MLINIDSALEAAERETLRLRAQAEQEIAMAEALPHRFALNIEAFKKYIPRIAEMYENYHPTRPFRFFCNENGQPNVAWIDDNIAVYGDEPYLICETLVKEFMEKGGLSRFSFSKEDNPLGFVHVEYLNRLNSYLENIASQEELLQNVPTEVPTALVFGVGLGYHLGYIYEKCKIGTLFLFEPDLDLFYASLFCFDWAPLLTYLNEENLGLQILLGQDEDTIVRDFASAIHSRGSFLIANAFIMWGYQNEKIKNLMLKIKQEYYLLVMGWGFFDDNLIALSHTVNNIERGIPFLKDNEKILKEQQDIPVFVIGNGPSLDESLDVIKANKNSAILIACGSAITALYNVGIKPDIYVATERTKGVYDFLVSMDADEYLKDILFLSLDVIHPYCSTLFRHSALLFKRSEPGISLCSTFFPETNNVTALGAVNPMVGNLGVSVPIHLGFKKIFLFGLDNGYKDKNHHHSKFSAYYNNEEGAKALTEIVCSENQLPREGNFGGFVISDPMFDTSRKVIEQVLEANDEVQCFNCSDGAKITGAKSLRSHKIDVLPSVNKKLVLNDIITRISSPLSLTKSDFYPLLDVDYFNYFIDKMLEEWQRDFSSRNEINQLMLRHFSYLHQIANTRQRHITIFMIGSMNYVFTLLTSIAYSFDGEEKTLSLIKPAINIWLDFLRATKEMYPMALDSVDMVDNHIVDLFRK